MNDEEDIKAVSIEDEQDALDEDCVMESDLEGSSDANALWIRIELNRESSPRLLKEGANEVRLMTSPDQNRQRLSRPCNSELSQDERQMGSSNGISDEKSYLILFK